MAARVGHPGGGATAVCDWREFPAFSRSCQVSSGWPAPAFANASAGECNCPPKLRNSEGGCAGHDSVTVDSSLSETALLVRAAVVPAFAPVARRERGFAGIAQLVRVVPEAAALLFGVCAVLLNIVGTDSAQPLVPPAPSSFFVCRLRIVLRIVLLFVRFLAAGKQHRRTKKKDRRSPGNGSSRKRHHSFSISRTVVCS